jgi:hypothetical protein
VLDLLDLVALTHDVTSAAKRDVKPDVKRRLLGLRAEGCDARRQLNIDPERRGMSEEIEPNLGNARRRKSESEKLELRETLLADTKVLVRLVLKLAMAALIADTGVRSHLLLRSRS